jgi:hypothetical protein
LTTEFPVVAIVFGRLEPLEVAEGKRGIAGLTAMLLRLARAAESIFGKLPTVLKGTWPGRVKYSVVYFKKKTKTR